jgi:hypothetical protein
MRKIAQKGFVELLVDDRMIEAGWLQRDDAGMYSDDDIGNAISAFLEFGNFPRKAKAAKAIYAGAVNKS